jgi:putative ABC transport system permease protein
MPPAKPSFSNRAMFWRILRRFITGNPGRLTVMLLALSAGATITAALLNLKVDAQRRLTTEFSAFGPNVVLAPRGPSSHPPASTLPESDYDAIPGTPANKGGAKSALLFVLSKARNHASERAADVVIVGSKEEGFAFVPLSITEISPSRTLPNCLVGIKAAEQLGAHAGDRVLMKTAVTEEICQVGLIQSYGSAEDSQIFLNLDVAQRLAGLPNRISVIRLRVPGTPQQIDQYIASLQQRLPDADVRPIRQFTEGEARIYNRISGVLTATVVLVLVLTALCVMAAMTNVAMERRNDVGLMKAIGGATRRVLRLFLVEAALLGLAGGVVGAALGIALSMWLGKAVFGLAARPRLIVYPVAVALTVIVAIAGAYPLRRLANIRPASVFRGEA